MAQMTMTFDAHRYRPTIPLAYLTNQLGFSKISDCGDFLNELKLTVTTSTAASGGKKTSHDDYMLKELDCKASQNAPL